MAPPRRLSRNAPASGITVDGRTEAPPHPHRSRRRTVAVAAAGAARGGRGSPHRLRWSCCRSASRGMRWRQHRCAAWKHECSATQVRETNAAHSELGTTPRSRYHRSASRGMHCSKIVEQLQGRARLERGESAVTAPAAETADAEHQDAPRRSRRAECARTRSNVGARPQKAVHLERAWSWTGQ